MLADFQTFVKDLVERHEMMTIVIGASPFWIRVFINSYIINRRDHTRYFILFLLPSEGAIAHGLESMFRFYWKPEDQNIGAKKASNVCSLIFAAFVVVSFAYILIRANNS